MPDLIDSFNCFFENKQGSPIEKLSLSTFPEQYQKNNSFWIQYIEKMFLEQKSNIFLIKPEQELNSRTLQIKCNNGFRQ